MTSGRAAARAILEAIQAGGGGESWGLAADNLRACTWRGERERDEREVWLSGRWWLAVGASVSRSRGIACSMQITPYRPPVVQRPKPT